MAAIRVSRRTGFAPFGRTVEDSLGSLGLLVIRLVFGYGIILHGLTKIQNPLHWADKQGIPSFFQLLAAVSEFGGGFALVFGLVTRLGAFGIACTMTVAILTAHKGMPFVPPSGGKGFELPALYGTVALALLLAGPGRFSLDHKLFAEKE